MWKVSGCDWVFYCNIWYSHKDHVLLRIVKKRTGVKQFGETLCFFTPQHCNAWRGCWSALLLPLPHFSGLARLCKFGIGSGNESDTHGVLWGWGGGPIFSHLVLFHPMVWFFFPCGVPCIGGVGVSIWWHSDEDSSKDRQSLGSLQWSMAPIPSLGREFPLFISELLPWSHDLFSCLWGPGELGKDLHQVYSAATPVVLSLPPFSTPKLPDQLYAPVLPFSMLITARLYVSSFFEDALMFSF